MAVRNETKCHKLQHSLLIDLAIIRRSIVSSASVRTAASVDEASVPASPIITSVLLNRSPILTTLPTPFEKAYHDYQARIARALSNPFPREFYFKKGAIAERQFFLEESQREKEAFGEAFGEAELAGLEEDKTGSMGQTEDVVALPRELESDQEEDVKNLNRKGDRNLYLLVEGEEGWRLPQGPANRGAALHTVSHTKLLYMHIHKFSQVALQELHSECGPDMDTWVVGRYPIGVHQPAESDSNTVRTDRSDPKFSLLNLSLDTIL